jgi:hypothetical protein
MPPTRGGVATRWRKVGKRFLIFKIGGIESRKKAKLQGKVRIFFL